MANYTIDKFTYGGNTYKLNDKDAMPKTGGTFTGEVTFNDTVTASDVTADSLVVQGNTSVVNGLQVSTINGVTVGSSPSFTNTTYTFANGTNGFKVTPSGGTAQTVTVTPSIANNITGSGTSGYLTKFNGTNTITNGPQLGSNDGKYLRHDGSWATPSGGIANAFVTVSADGTDIDASGEDTLTVSEGEGIDIVGDSSGKAVTIKNTAAVYSVMSGFTTTAGSASSPYLSVKWSVPNVGGITTPYNGMRVAIKIPMIGVETAGAVLSIDGGTTWHPLLYNVNTLLTSHFPANSVKYFTYDANQSANAYITAGTVTSITGCWKGDADYDSNSDHYTTAWCSTAAATQAKVANCTNFVLTANTFIPILFTQANSYNGKITLNINSTGAKDIYINGVVSSSSNKTLPAGTYIAYYDGSHYIINTDGTIPKVAPAYQYSTTDLTAGTSALTTGTLYFVYE